MFSQQQKTEYAKQLGVTLDELDTFIKRYRGYLNSKLLNDSLSFNIVLAGFKYLGDVKKEVRPESKPVIDFGTIRSEAIKRYGVEILELRDEGYGAKRICDAMNSRHNAKISKSSMDRFLNLNKRDNNGES